MRSPDRSALLNAFSLATACALLGCGAADKPLQNQPPLALLSCADAAEVGVPFEVDGTGSTDVDGEIAAAQLLLDPLAPPLEGLQGTVTPTRPGPLTVVLTLTDDKGAVSEARCRVIVTGALDDTPLDPSEPTDPDEPTAPDEPTDPEAPTDPTTPPWHEGAPTATARAYSVDCAFGWPLDWDDDGDVAEDVLGFAWWTCGHEELHASTALSNAFLTADTALGALDALPAMEDAPTRTSDLVVVYATRLVPPAEADAVRITVTGQDAVGVFARDFTVCDDGDDTDFCPLAVADGEWALDPLRDERVGPQALIDLSGPLDLELRAANHDGAMSWSVVIELFANGTLLDSAPHFEAR